MSSGPRLTVRKLRAMQAACAALLAGEQGEGDWPPSVAVEDLEASLAWINHRLAKATGK